MAKSADGGSELVRCAEVVERELRRLEELSKNALHIRLTSEKAILRAGRVLQQALEQQERLATELRNFGQAMAGMQSRQEAAVGPLGDRAAELQARMTRLSELMQQFGQLGMEAKGTADVLRGLSEAGDEPSAEGASALIDADVRVRALAEASASMAESARAEDFPDIASEAHALAQRMQALRERLSELVRAKSVGVS